MFYLSIIIILVAGLGFGLGRLSVIGEREPIRIEYDANVNPKSEILNPKQIQNSKRQIQNILFGKLGFKIWNLFRI